MSSAPNSVLTVAEVAEQLRVDVHKVRAWINAGELVASNVATTKATRPVYRIRAADLAAFLDGRASTQKVAGKPPRANRRATYREFV
jgi:excisionase family DNA binding protein